MVLIALVSAAIHAVTLQTNFSAVFITLNVPVVSFAVELGRLFIVVLAITTIFAYSHAVSCRQRLSAIR